MTTETKARQAEASDILRERLHPGDTVYTVLRHVSSSGMSRRISTFVIDTDNTPREITHLVARALDMRRNDRDGGLVISGCGMDMGFEIVYQLGRALFPDGFNVVGRGRNGDMSGHDNDGGYALKQDWL